MACERRVLGYFVSYRDLQLHNFKLLVRHTRVIGHFPLERKGKLATDILAMRIHRNLYQLFIDDDEVKSGSWKRDRGVAMMFS